MTVGRIEREMSARELDEWRQVARIEAEEQKKANVKRPRKRR